MGASGNGTCSVKWLIKCPVIIATANHQLSSSSGLALDVTERMVSRHIGKVLRLANPGTIPLEIVGVQSGSYLGQDDIVRFEYNYGRKG